MSKPNSTCIYLDHADHDGLALAQRLELPVKELSQAPIHWYLTSENGQLVLAHPTEPIFRFSDRSLRSRLAAAFRSDLVRACGYFPGRKVLDCYGGWGIDSLIFAAAGCDVIVTEVNPTLCAFIRNNAQDFNIEMTVLCEDVLQFLQRTEESFDTIYLDPMFLPHPTTAKPHRRMQILEQIAEPTRTLKKVFQLALARARDRVVVKNRKSQRLLVPKPGWEIKRRSIRFDVYRPVQRQL